MTTSDTTVLEPSAQELAEDTSGHPGIHELPPEEGRRLLADLQSRAGVPKPAVHEEWIDVVGGPTGVVPTRVVRPKGVTGELPVILYIHGAGWVFGDEHTHDRLVRELAVGAEAAVVFPLYDRSPEARFPTAIQQNHAVGEWIVEHGAAHRLDAARIAVCGDSVGGNMATVLAMMALDNTRFNLVSQVLLYPVTDADFGTDSYREFADGYYLTRDAMKWFWDQYLSDPAQRLDPYASPLRADPERLRGMPPTLVITGEADVLRDEGEAYAERLRAAGVEVTAVRVLGMVHDFLMLDRLRDTQAARAARLLATDALDQALHPRA